MSICKLCRVIKKCDLPCKGIATTCKYLKL